MTAEEAGEKWNVHKITVLKWAKQGKIPSRLCSMKVNGNVHVMRIIPDDVAPPFPMLLNLGTDGREAFAKLHPDIQQIMRLMSSNALTTREIMRRTGCTRDDVFYSLDELLRLMHMDDE